MSGVPFECAYKTDHVGNEVITVSRGRTWSTSSSFSIAGVPGRVHLGLSTTSSTSSTTVNRLTIHGQLTDAQSYSLCGNDDYAIYATWAREK